MILLSPQLEAFMAIVENKTVIAGAHSLHLTQTAVTQRLKTLENRLKVSLFKRTRRGMILTHEGESLWRYCQQVRQMEGEALAHLGNVGKTDQVTFRMSGPTSMMHARVIPALVPIVQHFPELLLHLNVNDLETNHQLLKKGEVDMAIIHKEFLSPEMSSKPLKPECYLLVAPKAWANRSIHDLLSKEKIIDFDPKDQMTINYLQHFQLYEEAHLTRHFVNHTEMMAELIVRGVGFGVLAEEFLNVGHIKENLVVLNKGQVYKHELLLAWFASPYERSYFKAILESVI